MGIGEAEAFSERLKRELQALEAANVHAILESEPLIGEVTTNCPSPFEIYIYTWFHCLDLMEFMVLHIDICLTSFYIIS